MSKIYPDTIYSILKDGSKLYIDVNSSNAELFDISSSSISILEVIIRFKKSDDKLIKRLLEYDIKELRQFDKIKMYMIMILILLLLLVGYIILRRS